MKYLFVLPALLFCIFFRIIPLFMVTGLSFFETDFLETQWAGVSNYVHIFQTPELRAPMANTWWYMGIVPLTLCLAFLIATASQSLKKVTQHYLRVIVYIPSLVTGVVMATVWKWIFHYDGLVNAIFGTEVLWFSTRALSVVPITIIQTLSSVGFYTIILMAALKAIPQERYDIAAIEGASSWQVRRYIMLPGITRTVGLMAILLTGATVQIFGLIYLLAPYPYASTMMYALFRESFLYGRFGVGAAYSVMLMMITMLLIVGQWRVRRG